MSVKKIVTAAVLATAALASAAPACATDGGRHIGPAEPPRPWDFSSAVSCLQEMAVVPVLSHWGGDEAEHLNHCGSGNG
ncbi:hypothetical protein ABH940_002090 [Streptacidiphilus sp. BW17]|uniref:hypothetical protein n=1 Tax=Streptacidiphilus sp. BW17 TaxID=3156274 RepID=UPI003518A0C8